ncbi:tetratricopeptide repeat protein [Paracerasibacillus soli]|uniref:Tetratricopeptide repeat protein n=1 Tax=Paracerasibacillus soli TaxID=480284 RepID=A0ABU5CSR6_9BACI|nr:hypothetical protein [Virgibacillus soli]MDY0409432.1 hypothetical protein [Virgibacillus soli]
MGKVEFEFYKSLQKTNRVVVTFDSINMVWDNPSFAFNLLIQQNVDIIAIRKRRKKVYQQDLSLEDFKRTVSALVEGYEDKVAYGFSLGAYGALYYASALNCRILALSPRMSIHPIYGKSNLKGKRIFKHNILPTHNSEISPIIVYDPKNALDNTYVNKGLLSAFPNAQLVEIPYAGHGMGPHLKQMGLLKEFILTVIHKAEIPIYDKELKKSQTYYRVLGDACLKRNKPRWALQLVNYALTLAPEDSLCMRLKIHVLRRKERYTEAIQFAESSRELAPQDRVIPGLLIDLYVYIGDFEKAIEETEAAIKKFGSTAPLLKRKKRIQELQEKHVHNAVKL